MSRADWQTMQDELLQELEVEETVVIMLNNGVGFDSYNSRAVVRGHNERDLVPGGSIQQGDLKVMISASRYPGAVNRPLERKDRIMINGKPHSIVHYDENTRNIAGTAIMYEITCRG